MTDKHRPSARYLLAATAAVLLLTATSCELLLDASGSGGGDTPNSVYDIVPVLFTNSSIDSASQIQKVNFSSPITTLILTGLTGQNVLLVKTNLGETKASANSTGSADSSFISTSKANPRTISSKLSQLSMSGVLSGKSKGRNISGVYSDLIRTDYVPAQEPKFGATLETNSRSISSTISLPLLAANVPLRAYTLVGTDTRDFWILNADQTTWRKITAVLRSIGDHCYIWVPESNFGITTIYNDNTLNLLQVNNLKAKFDLIYPLATNVLGYENGGDGTGGVDNDAKISILVYDIEEDYSSTQNGGVLGYFWSKDYYDTSVQIHSNESEMFYIDSHFSDAFPDYIYSTLIHEFQHMINFNQKNIKNSISSPVWYNEMLSLVAEDMIGSHASLGITPYALPYHSRLALFTGYYDYAGITEWLSGGDVLASYSNAYAFGAYLARNYGGANLINAIESNNSVDISSISEGLFTVDSSFLDITSGFKKVIQRYGEALIYSKDSTPSEINTFNRPVSTVYSGITYTFPEFNIWNETNYFAGQYGVPDSYKGLLVWGLSQSDLPPYSVSLQSSASWQNKSGSLSITLHKPTDPDIELYLMVR